MQWLNDHPLFLGIVASLIAGVILIYVGWLFTKSKTPPAPTPPPTNANAGTNQNTNQNTLTVNFAHPAPPAPEPTPPAPPPPQPRQLPNMVFKKGYLGNVWHKTPGIWSGIYSGKKAEVPALLVEFQNAASVERHVGGQVWAFIEFSPASGGDITAVRGCWLEESGRYADFPVDTIHRLLVAIILGRGEIVAVAKMNNSVMGEIPTESLVVEGTQPWRVHIRLTDANVGNILYEGNFRVTHNPPTITRDAPLVT